MTHEKRIAACFAFVLLALASLPTMAADGQVNINDAGADELALLPRVGAVVAQRIVEFREQNGRFTDSADLMLVRGIGERTFELIEPWVSLEGETTLTEKVKVAQASADGKEQSN